MRRRQRAHAVLAAWVACAGLAAAGCGEGGDEPPSAEGPRRDTWVADTQYVRDSLGHDLMIIVRRPAGRVHEVEPRAGSGDPDAPGAVEGLEARDAAALVANMTPAPLILDVRDSETYVRQGWIPGAFLIDHAQLEENIGEIHARTDQMVLVYGDDDVRVESAARMLASYGFPTVRWIRGGFLQWAALDLPVERYP